MTTTGQAAYYEPEAKKAFTVNYATLTTPPAAGKTWAESANSGDYTVGTGAASIVAVKDAKYMKMTDNVCAAAEFNTLYTEVVHKDAKLSVQVAPVRPVKGGAAPAKETAPAKKTETKAVVVEKKTEVKATVVAKTTDEKKKDEKEPAKPKDGPGACVQEKLCETKDETTKLTITCDAVRLGAAALAALAVASTL